MDSIVNLGYVRESIKRKRRHVQYTQAGSVFNATRQNVWTSRGEHSVVFQPSFLHYVPGGATDLPWILENTRTMTPFALRGQIFLLISGFSNDLPAARELLL